MKKLTLLLALCGLTLVAKATYPQTLPIDYNQFFAPTAINANGTDLVRDVYPNQTPTPVPATTIMANEWTFLYSATPLVSLTVESNTLSFSNYIDNNAGKEIVFPPIVSPATSLTRNNTYYPLTSSATAYTGKAFYLSALINMSSFRSGDAFLFFGNTLLGNYVRGRVHAMTNGTGYSLGVLFNTESAETAVNGTTLLNLNQTYLIVVKITPMVTGTETVSVFVNPVLGGAEPATAEATTSVATPALKNINGISLRATFTGKMSGLRFSDNWEDVVKVYVPKLSIPVAQDGTNISETSFTAHWAPVDNATAYDVDVYLGTNLFSTTTISGQSSSSLDITALPSGLLYNYKVLAKGDGINFANSDPSQIINVQTLGAVTAVNTNFEDGTWGVTTDRTAAPWSENGFTVASGTLKSGTYTGPNGETHTNAIQLLALNASTPLVVGMLDFPTLNSVEKIEIHAFSGSATTRKMLLKELVGGTTWTTVNTFTLAAAAGIEEIFSYSIHKAVPTKFRIETGSYSALSITQIITTPYLTAIDELNVSGTLSVIGNTIIASEAGNMEVYNLQGAKLLQAKEVSKLNTNLTNGLYVVRFTNHNGQCTTSKLIFSTK